ncbi:MAG TPA: hypothetical protein PKH77_10175 [Anaerolineae bacterium]|nr:hypothetical protein [Anaerolineae bacterium]
MEQPEITDKDREMALFCKEQCPICKQGRKRQRGLLYWFVKNVEPRLGCPYCAAYEKVYGRKAYEPEA